VAENIETLYDVEILYGDMARRLGFKSFIRARCVNDDPLFIESLADSVRRALGAS